MTMLERVRGFTFVWLIFQLSKYQEIFGSLSGKVKAVLYAPIQPSASNLLWQPAILVDVLENPK